MLNKNNERELAYLVIVDNITEMDADRLECAHIGGWHCVVSKGEFKPGDLAVYIESDSKVPDEEPFSSMEFLRSKDFKIKPQKIRGEISHGLLVPLSMFAVDFSNRSVNDETRFLTKELNITYYVPEDNRRKAKSGDKYKAMSGRHQKLAKTRLWRFLYKRPWGKKLLFMLFGKKKDKKKSWPSWVVKTDEERCQNMPWLFTDKSWKDSKWIATEKIDGTSTTFTMKGFGKKRQFYICSRNVVFDTPDKTCYYDTNVYTEMAEKYNIKEVLSKTLDKLKETDNRIEFVTIQGETYGEGIQKRDYSLKEHKFMVFNIIYGYKDGTTCRLNPIKGAEVAKKAGLDFVPIIQEDFTLPDTCEELLKIATGNSAVDGKMREGIVFRTYDGERSFKAVSDEYLVKFHG